MSQYGGSSSGRKLQLHNLRKYGSGTFIVEKNEKALFLISIVKILREIVYDMEEEESILFKIPKKMFFPQILDKFQKCHLLMNKLHFCTIYAWTLNHVWVSPKHTANAKSFYGKETFHFWGQYSKKFLLEM